MMKKIFAFTLAVLMLSVLLIPAVQAIMVHDHGEVCALLAIEPQAICCSNMNRVNYIKDHQKPGGRYCIGTLYNRCSNCGDTISGPYMNSSSKCIDTCFLPVWPY